MGNGIYVVMCLFVLCGLGCLFGLAPVSGPDSRLDSEIDGLISSELALGSSTAQVKAWLVSKKVDNIAYHNQRLDYEASVTQSRFKPSQLSGIMNTSLDTGKSYGFKTLTRITFFFDKKGRLIGHSIVRGGVGL